MESPRVREIADDAHLVKEHGAAVFIPDSGRGDEPRLDGCRTKREVLRLRLRMTSAFLSECFLVGMTVIFLRRALRLGFERSIAFGI